MFLRKLKIANFRCYGEQVEIDFDNLTVIIGKNDIGKSTILDALNIFFEQQPLEQSDTCIYTGNEQVLISCVFANLPDKLIIDRDSPTDLNSEYLLNSDGQFEVKKIFNCALKTPKLSATYIVALHPASQDYNDLHSLKNKELKDRASLLSIELAHVDTRKNPLLRRAIWDHCADLNLQLADVPVDQESTKKVWEEIKKYMPSFALFKSDRASTDQDEEAQDPMKAAIKEALRNQEDRIKKVADAVEAEVKSIAEATLAKLNEMDSSLASQLSPNISHTAWDKVFRVSLTGDDEIPINKRGSGVRRLVLLNFFRAKAEKAAFQKGSQSIIYAIEEPETSQHPSSQRLLMKAFLELSQNLNCQVMLTTHTPVLARLVPLDSLRYIKQEQGAASRKVYQATDEICAELTKELGVLPDHNIKLFIGVEGVNDINFLKGICTVLLSEGINCPDLDKLERDNIVVFIPLGGTNLALWTNRFKGLNIPEFHIYDGDGQAKYQAHVNQINARPGCKAVFCSKREMENYLHGDAILNEFSGITLNVNDIDDTPKLLAKAVYEARNPGAQFDHLDKQRKKAEESKIKQVLNTKVVQHMTKALLDNRDPAGELMGWLAHINGFVS